MEGIETIGHTANFLGGTIRDALYGIHVNNDGHLSARGVSFSNNFVGMYFTSTPSHLIVGNRFNGGTLLPAYTGMPGFANKNLCGIYSEVTYSSDFLSSSGNYSLNVGKVNDIRNIFENMNNGIICHGTFNVNIKNNSFLNLPIVDVGPINDFTLNSTNLGNGVMVQGGGLFGGVYFEENLFENGTQGILSSGVPSVLSIKNNNRFINQELGVHAIDNGFIFSLNLIVENNNEFECRSKGIFSNRNSGHYFSLKNNTFRLSGIVDQVNPAGFHGLGLIGFFGRTGDGNINDNDFLIGSVNQHSNGAVQVINYKSVDMSNHNVFHFLTPSPINQSGHTGYLFDNLNHSTVRDNELYNFSVMPRSGVNSITNVVNNAICCNKMIGLNTGLALINSNTSTSTFKQNEMLDNNVGLRLALNCAIGDQLDHGNIWTGVSRVASRENTNPDLNLFFC
ncbi:MAG: hypothetical protein IPN86_17165 [Saprospiraceae bacterium]|nr:hypothetical protein [Saprospiraceae bacterium]